MKSTQSYIGVTLVGLLLCGAAVSAIFLDEEALAEVAEREGYAAAGQAVHRARRQADECRCPPPPPGPFPGGDDDDMPPPPPPSGSGSSEEGGRPPRPRGPPRGCWPPPPPPGPFGPGPYGPHRHHHPHRMGSEPSNGPACELRPLFRAPEKFNFTARVACFDMWESDQAKRMGMSPEDRFDMSKFKPTQRKPLMWNKGCDMQCHFMEMDLLTTGDNGENAAVSAEAVAALLKEEGDGSDVTAAVDKAVESCLAEGAEMVHAKQVCQSGADEVLFCLQRTLAETCPGAKWQGQRSCDEVANVASKLRICWHRRPFHLPRFNPHGPTPSYFWGPPGGPGMPDFGKPFPPSPVGPNVLTGPDDAIDGKSQS